MLTPGVGATKEAKRLSLAEAATLTKIPVLPHSYADARPLLAALQGPVAPENWRGALPITYHVGPGPARVHLKVSFNWDIKPIYDVIARIDVREPTVAPQREPPVPHLNFAPLDDAVDRLTESADVYAKALHRARVDGRWTVPDETLRKVNTLLLTSERWLAHPGGLPGRDWFKHLIYAPGLYSGYAVKTMPGVREAIELKNWQEAETEVTRVAQALVNEAALIEAASHLLVDGSNSAPPR